MIKHDKSKGFIKICISVLRFIKDILPTSQSMILVVDKTIEKHLFMKEWKVNLRKIWKVHLPFDSRVYYGITEDLNCPIWYEDLLRNLVWSDGKVSRGILSSDRALLVPGYTRDK